MRVTHRPDTITAPETVLDRDVLFKARAELWEVYDLLDNMPDGYPTRAIREAVLESIRRVRKALNSPRKISEAIEAAARRSGAA